MVMSGGESVTVNVDRGCRGDWQVEMPDHHEHVSCETLEDAERIAFLWAAQRHPCQLVIRDAYHRVLRREFVDGDTAAVRERTTTAAAA